MVKKGQQIRHLFGLGQCPKVNGLFLWMASISLKNTTYISHIQTGNTNSFSTHPFDVVEPITVITSALVPNLFHLIDLPLPVPTPIVTFVSTSTPGPAPGLASVTHPGMPEWLLKCVSSKNLGGSWPLFRFALGCWEDVKYYNSNVPLWAITHFNSFSKLQCNSNAAVSRMVPILNIVTVKFFGLFCLSISFFGVWMGWDILWVRTTGVATAQKLF